MRANEHFNLSYDSKGNTYIYSVKYSSPIAKVINEWECKDLMNELPSWDVEDKIEEFEQEVGRLENEIQDLEEQISEYKDVLKRIDKIVKLHYINKNCLIPEIERELKDLEY